MQITTEKPKNQKKIKAEVKYSPNQVLTNRQIDILTAPNKTWKGGTIAEEIFFE